MIYLFLFYVLFSIVRQKCSVKNSSASFNVSYFAWWRSVEMVPISQLVHPSSVSTASGPNDSTTTWKSIAHALGLIEITVSITQICVFMWSNTSKFPNWLYPKEMLENLKIRGIFYYETKGMWRRQFTCINMHKNSKIRHFKSSKILKWDTVLF